MSKNLSHMTNIHEAANELHKLLVNSPGYIGTQVMSLPETSSIVTSKQDKRYIVVYVKSEEYLLKESSFNSWPVRYGLGA